LMCVMRWIVAAWPRSPREEWRLRRRRWGAAESRSAGMGKGVCQGGMEANRALLRPGRGDGCAAVRVGADAS
jgi:hypothetical protein